AVARVDLCGNTSPAERAGPRTRGTGHLSAIPAGVVELVFPAEVAASARIDVGLPRLFFHAFDGVLDGEGFGADIAEETAASVGDESLYELGVVEREPLAIELARDGALVTVAPESPPFVVERVGAS